MRERKSVRVWKPVHALTIDDGRVGTKAQSRARTVLSVSLSLFSLARPGVRDRHEPKKRLTFLAGKSLGVGWMTRGCFTAQRGSSSEL